MPAKALMVLRLVRRGTVAPHTEPVSVGVPLPCGAMRQPELEAVAADGRALPSQATVLARWPDGSVRWALLDLLVAAERSSEAQVEVRVRTGGAPAAAPIALRELPGQYAVDTGAVRLEITRDVFAPFAALRCAEGVPSTALHSALVFEDRRGRRLLPCLESLAVEPGAVRLSFKIGRAHV